MVTFAGFFLMCCAITEIVPVNSQINSDYSMKLKSESRAGVLNNGTIKPDLDTEFVPHKCCKIDQVYQLGHGIEHCRNITDSNWTSLFSQNFNTDIIATGFPQNCSENDLMLLQPQTMPADRFILLPSGQLILPHRFWILSSDDYCMDDFVSDNSPVEKRSVIICTKHIKEFPSTATDNLGRLRLSFLESPDENLSRFSDKMIVHKCCDLNEAYLVNNLTCISNEGYSTQFLNQLQENGNYFFRIGPITCQDQNQVEHFQITSTGQLQVELDDEQTLLVHPDDYCLDDFVIFWDDQLPEVITLVNYCPNSNKSLTLALESDVAATEPKSDKTVVTDIPKCCPKGQIITGKGCQNFKLINQESKMEAIILRAFRSHISAPNETLNLLANTFSLAYENAKAIELDHDLAANKSWITPIFEINANGNVSYFIHYFKENFWDYKAEVNPFCLEMKIFDESLDIFYRPVVLYWTSPFQVPAYLIYLHFISVAALLVTIWIYCIVPASSSAKLLASGSSRARRSRAMACTLTGRNLLCHSISLTIFFSVLALNQLEIYSPGESGCVAMGYLLYWSAMASFAWSTVYCFDYVWMFRGSFQVSDTYKFIPYSVFGWGIPIIFLSIASVAQFQSSEVAGLPPSLNPNFGLIRCWFSDEIVSVLVLFYGPVGFLLSLNVMFFIRLLLNPNLMNCYKKKNSGPQLRTNHTKENESSLQKYKDDIKMALKLFFITGIPWIFEVVNWTLKVTGYPPSNILFDIANLCNSLRGITIFFVFVLLQRNVRLHLQLTFRKCSSVLMRKRTGPRQSVDSLSQDNAESVNTESLSNIFNSNVPSTSPSSSRAHQETVSTSSDRTSNI